MTQMENHHLYTSLPNPVPIDYSIDAVAIDQAQYGFVSELRYVTNSAGQIVDGMMVGIARMSDASRDKTVRYMVYVPTSEHIQENEKVEVYTFVHRDGHTGLLNRTRFAKALPADYHGF